MWLLNACKVSLSTIVQQNYTEQTILHRKPQAVAITRGFSESELERLFEINKKYTEALYWSLYWP